jgi:hypothetical protein
MMRAAVGKGSASEVRIPRANAAGRRPNGPASESQPPVAAQYLLLDISPPLAPPGIARSAGAYRRAS